MPAARHAQFQPPHQVSDALHFELDRRFGGRVSNELGLFRQGRNLFDGGSVGDEARQIVAPGLRRGGDFLLDLDERLAKVESGDQRTARGRVGMSVGPAKPRRLQMDFPGECAAARRAACVSSILVSR